MSMHYCAVQLIGIGPTPEIAADAAQARLNDWSSDHPDRVPLTHTVTIQLLPDGNRQLILILHTIGWMD